MLNEVAHVCYLFVAGGWISAGFVSKWIIYYSISIITIDARRGLTLVDLKAAIVASVPRLTLAAVIIYHINTST